MAKLFTMPFNGESGKQYEFDFYDISSGWHEVTGIYIVAYYNKSKNTVRSIYVGETDNLKNRFLAHHKQTCFDENYANVLGWMGEPNEKTRLSIEDDLLKSLKPPCND